MDKSNRTRARSIAGPFALGGDVLARNPATVPCVSSAEVAAMNTPMPAALPYEFPELALAQGMNQDQRTVYFNAFSRSRKDVTAAVLLAVFLGGFGAHRFYMGEIGWGVVYVLFSWTCIPMIAGLVEAFLMPERVRIYNVVQAQILAAQVRAG